MNTTVALIHYDAARKALAEASRIDEVKEIRDRAEALRAYARQRDDVDMERWVAEIKLRATIRIGELSRELDHASAGRKGKSVPVVEPISKADALKAAGISKATAHRAEQLAEPSARKKVEKYIAEQAAAEKPVTITQALKVAAPRPDPRRSDFPFVRQYHAVLGRVRSFLRPHGLPYRMLWLSALQDGIEDEMHALERQDRVGSNARCDPGLLSFASATEVPAAPLHGL